MRVTSVPLDDGVNVDDKFVVEIVKIMEADVVEAILHVVCRIQPQHHRSCIQGITHTRAKIQQYRAVLGVLSSNPIWRGGGGRASCMVDQFQPDP